MNLWLFVESCGHDGMVVARYLKWSHVTKFVSKLWNASGFLSVAREPKWILYMECKNCLLSKSKYSLPVLYAAITAAGHSNLHKKWAKYLYTKK